MIKHSFLLLTFLLYSYSFAKAQKSCIDIRAENLLSDKQAFDLSGYDGFLIGESHRAPEEEVLKLALLKHLNKEYGVTDVFMEIGNSAAYLCNRYLETGNDSFRMLPKVVLGMFPEEEKFWKSLYEYNKQAEKKIRIWGIDFEREDYLKTLRLLMPQGKEKPEQIKDRLTFIDTLRANRSTMKLWNMKTYYVLRKEVEQNKQYYKEFYGANYHQFEQVILNRNTFKNYPGRDSNMKLTMLEHIRSNDIKKFVLFIGGGHVDTVNKNRLGNLLLSDASFKIKTARIAPAYKNKGEEEYKYFFNRYNYKKNKKILAPLFSKYATPGCDYTVLPSGAIDNEEVRKQGDFVILSHIAWKEEK